MLGRSWWGRGFMTEAARAPSWSGAWPDPAIYRVWAVTDVDNTASARVLEKTGMLREGRLRALAHPPEPCALEPRDCWCFARVR